MLSLEEKKKRQGEYNRTKRGKELMHRRVKKYQATERGKEVHSRSVKKYNASERGKETNRRAQKKYNNKNREITLVYYGGNPPKCACCGEQRKEFLTIDHIYGGGQKEFNLHGYGTNFRKWLIKNNLPGGYRILCWNCNCSLGIRGYCPHDKEKLELERRGAKNEPTK